MTKLVVLNLVANIPLKSFDFLESFVINIGPRVILVDFISKYDLHTLYESRRSKIQLF
jgi:hypothetical protein